MKSTDWYRITLSGFLVVLLAACSQSQTVSPTLQVETPAATQLEKDGTQMPSPTLPAGSTGMESLIEQAKEDLAQRLSISAGEITLVEAREVVWPDSSLGCPQPGMKYLQVPEDGALILLNAQEMAYEYHTGGSRGLFLCEKQVKDPYPHPQLDIDLQTPSPVERLYPEPPAPDNSIPPGENQ